MLNYTRFWQAKDSSHLLTFHLNTVPSLYYKQYAYSHFAKLHFPNQAPNCLGDFSSATWCFYTNALRKEFLPYVPTSVIDLNSIWPCIYCYILLDYIMTQWMWVIGRECGNFLNKIIFIHIYATYTASSILVSSSFEGHLYNMNVVHDLVHLIDIWRVWSERHCAPVIKILFKFTYIVFVMTFRGNNWKKQKISATKLTKNQINQLEKVKKCYWKTKTSFWRILRKEQTLMNVRVTLRLQPKVRTSIKNFRYVTLRGFWYWYLQKNCWYKV